MLPVNLAPGIGVVMGSKNLRLLYLRELKKFPLADPEAYKKLVSNAYADIKAKEYYGFWIRRAPWQQ
jgi:aldehyde:ferredoxin oxidoreductase